MVSAPDFESKSPGFKSCWRQNSAMTVHCFFAQPFIIIYSLSGVVRWCEGVMYLTSLGRPTDIGLQLGKACYPCSG